MSPPDEIVTAVDAISRVPISEETKESLTPNFFNRMKIRIRDAPDNLRLAAISAWRGRERGMAVFAGVFLASLVITTVLAYGVGLSQVFFAGSLEAQIFDAKIEFKDAPGEDVEGWSNNTTHLIEVCDELTLMEEFSDCTVVFGKKGMHRAFDFSNTDAWKSIPLMMEEINSSSSNRSWDESGIWNYDYTTGPPVSDRRAISLLGPGAFDGPIADRISQNIIYEMGEWLPSDEVEDQRGIYIPADIASTSKSQVGDNLERLTFTYVTESALAGELDEDECTGEVYIVGEGYMHCLQSITVENLTILGVYEPWPQSNPTLPANPVYTTWSVLNESQQKTLIDADHVYLGVAIDRSLLPTESTDDAAQWLEELSRTVMKTTDENGSTVSREYGSADIQVYYSDIVSGTILFLNIFLGLIQAFDYIIMVPIVILSLSVLVYGLVLSLEQRRREVSIHRVIGATSQGLRGMVVLELAVISSAAWFFGYLLAMAAVPVVLASVGFMQFEPLDYPVNPMLSITATIFTAIATVGLALIFGRGRAREFMELEIDEGVSKVQKVAKPKVWLHWTLFIFGSLGAIDTWMEMNGSEDGILSNWFVEGIVNIFGPFMLWIGGALILGKLGAAGPKIIQFFFSRSPLLSDVKRGLKGSGSTESVNRLAVIMLLTLSIVTLAAVQGYTGTLVDERTADVAVGSDLQVVSLESYTDDEIEAIVTEISGTESSVIAVNVPALILQPQGGESLLAYVLMNESADVLKWFPQAVPGDDVSAAMDAYLNGGFSAGIDAAYDMDLCENDYGCGNELLGIGNERSQNVTFDWNQYEFIMTEGDDSEEPSLMELFAAYVELMEDDWSNLSLSNQDLSGRDLGRADFSNTNLSGANLQNANLSESLLFNVNLEGADLSGANLQNTVFVMTSISQVNFSGANLMGAFGLDGFSESPMNFATVESVENATCPDGTIANETNCAPGMSMQPPPLALQLFAESSGIQINITTYNTSLRYIGHHEFIPGVNTETMESSVIIGESGYRSLVGNDAVDNLSASTWIIKVEGYSGENLQALRASIEADSRFDSAIDWESQHEEVERSGGLIFGTQGLLSLQFIVASLAAVASAFVFLSLVLNQRQKELAVLQAIGASPNQIIRLVLFEILSIVIVSMALGVLLGMGLALSFNGLFNVFGFIFQLLGGTGGESSIISRELQWPWLELGIVAVSVFVAVVLALLVTTRKALKSDLASVLKGE